MTKDNSITTSGSAPCLPRRRVCDTQSKNRATNKEPGGVDWRWLWGRNRAEMKNNGWTSENKECAGDKWWSGREGKRRGQRERKDAGRVGGWGGVLQDRQDEERAGDSRRSQMAMLIASAELWQHFIINRGRKLIREVTVCYRIRAYKYCTSTRRSLRQLFH